MKVLLIHQVFLTPRDGGGTRHYELGRVVIANGDAFSVIASDTNYLDGKAYTASDEVIDEIEVRRAKMLKNIHKSYVMRLVAFFTFMITSVKRAMGVKNVDLVMGTSPPMFQAFSAWLVARLKGVPFLLEVRDLWVDFAIDMGVLKNPVLIWLGRRAESFLLHRADHILVNSPAYKRHFIEKNKVSPDRISLVSNGVDPDMFDPNEKGENLRKEFGLEGKFVVVYAGAIGAANDTSTIIRAAALLKDEPNIHFLFVGDGKDRKNVESMAVTLGLKNVTFAGVRPKAEMKQFMGMADAAIATLMNIPMFTTTYPNKVFDYLAAGRPIVLGIDGVIREVVEASNAGVFAQPGDEKAIVDAVHKLAAMTPEERRSMGERGRAHVVEHFNRHKQGLQFVEVLRKVVGARSKKP